MEADPILAGRGQPLTKSASSSLRLAVACALLLLATWGGVLDAPFVADDWNHLHRVLGADRWHDVAVSFTGTWHGETVAPWFYRPLAVLSFAIDATLYGTHPTGWHATTFAIFLVTALLLAAAVRALFGRLGVDRTLAARAGAIAAALFCVLPSQLEAIAWISNRDGPLANALGLATLALWIRDRRVLATLFAALALCAKEMAVAWILLAIGLTWLLAWHEHRGRSIRVALFRALPLFAVLLLYFAARRVMFGTFGTGQSDVLADLHGANGASLLATNVLTWLRFVPWPVGSDLLGPLAIPLGVVCATLAAAPWLLGLIGSTGPMRVTRRQLLGVLVAGIVAAVVLLGPIVFVIAIPEDLRNTRFVPLVALPLAAASGFAWAVALAGHARRGALALLVTSIIVQASIGAIHSGAFAMVAKDLDAARTTIRDEVASGRIDPARLAVPITLLDPPRTGPAAFTLLNAFYGFLLRPANEVDVNVGILSREEFAIARLLPEFRAQFESGAVVLPRAPPLVPRRPFERLASVLGRFERFGYGAPLTIRREHPVAAPPAVASDGSFPPFEALDVAALSIEIPADAPPPASIVVEWSASRGDGRLVVSSPRRPAIVALASEPRWLAAGTVRSFRASVAGVGAGAPRAVTLLARLPEIRVLPGTQDSIVRGDPLAPIEVVFVPPFACARYRVRAIPSLVGMIGDTFDAARLDVRRNGEVHVRFEQGMAAGRRTTLDWRFIKAAAARGKVLWFVEGVDGNGQDASVVARSAMQALPAAPP